MELYNEIISLISSKREGNYWDFKEEPYENNASLLHDIICLSNSLHNGNKYLIIGATDPNNGATIKGLSPNQKGRKSQVQYIDFLRTKSFAGHSRPEIELHTISIQGKEIDILIIFDKPLKPYYLTEDYEFNTGEGGKTIVRANNIYTRTNDTNTPINKSADIGIIEKMWRQRFGLDLSPLERIKILLHEPDEWFMDIGNKSYAYHEQFPEYNIEFSGVEKFWETFSFFFINESSFLGNAIFKYHSTILFEQEYIYCDEMRVVLAGPKTEYIRIGDTENWYYYYELSEIEGKFLYFLTNKLTNLNSRGSRFPFLLFKNKQERKSFNSFLIDNQQLVKETEPTAAGKYALERMKKGDKNTVMDPIFIDKAKQIYLEWIKNN